MTFLNLRLVQGFECATSQGATNNMWDKL